MVVREQLKCNCIALPRSDHTTGLTGVTRRMLLVEHELLSILRVGVRRFSGVRVAQSLILYVVFCRSLFVILSFLFWPWYRMSS